VLSSDNESDTNYISRRVARDIMRIKDAPRASDGISNGMAAGLKQRRTKEGCLELVWRYHKRPGREYSTRFEVSAAEDPPYEAMLGRKESSKHGFRKSVSYRTRPKDVNRKDLNNCTVSIPLIYLLYLLKYKN
jgi:hypothetical protein